MWIAIFACLIISTYSFSSGAGSCDNPGACMTSGSAGAFHLTCPSTYTSGSTISVTLATSSGANFAGFLLYATDSSGNRVGVFTLDSNSQNLKCSGSSGSTITQKSATGWPASKVFTYTPPATGGTISFHGIGVLSGAVWSNLPTCTSAPQAAPVPVAAPVVAPVPVAAPTSKGPGTAMPFNRSAVVTPQNNERAYWRIPLLTWDDNVAALAQDQANLCQWSLPSPQQLIIQGQLLAQKRGVAWNASDPALTLYESHSGGFNNAIPVGAEWLNGYRAVWNCPTDQCNKTGCTAYKTIIWKDTTHIGCGMSLCFVNNPFNPPSPWNILVCQYNSASKPNQVHPFGNNPLPYCDHTAPIPPPVVAPVPVPKATPITIPVPVPAPVAVPASSGTTGTVPAVPASSGTTGAVPTPGTNPSAPHAPTTTPVAPTPSAAPKTPTPNPVPSVPIPRAAPVPVGPGTPLTFDPKIFLDPHNAERSYWTVPLLKWDNDLQRVAQAAANQCEWNYVTNYSDVRSTALAQIKGYPFTGSRDQRVGEGHTLDISFWSQLRSDWTCTTDTCTPDQDCLPYRQMIWAKTDLLGCGYANCTNNAAGLGTPWWPYVVCLYNEGGLWIGEHPFGTDSAKYCARNGAPSAVRSPPPLISQLTGAPIPTPTPTPTTTTGHPTAAPTVAPAASTTGPTSSGVPVVAPVQVPSNDSESGGGLPGWGIGLLVVGAVAAVLLIIAAIAFLLTQPAPNPERF